MIVMGSSIPGIVIELRGDDDTSMLAHPFNMVPADIAAVLANISLREIPLVLFIFGTVSPPHLKF
jgi:hypothetical protein